MIELQTLIAIEQSLWKNEPDVYEATYLSDAVLIFPEVGKIGRDTAVEAIREENRLGRHWAEVLLEDAAVVGLSANVAVLTYRATARWNDATASEKTLCTTIYVERAGTWRVALHQQTPA